MSILWDGIVWLFDPDNWWGNSGLIHRIVEQLQYSAWALALALAIGFPIGLVIGHTGRGKLFAATTANVLRAVPTYGIIALLFIWKPVTLWPLLGALAILAIPPIMLNTAAGVSGVDPQVRDAAEGVGLTGWQTLTRVEVPIALPLILAGVRSAANQVIATATVLGFKGQGGLGLYIFSGYGTQRYYIVYGASLAVIILVLVVEGAFAVGQRRVVSPGLSIAGKGARLQARNLSTLVRNKSPELLGPDSFGENT